MEFGIVELSRLQFAMTAMYHFLFVPLSLGLSILVAIMETVYVMTNRPIWRQMTKFWGTLFGINFVLGVATGITMEFQFGMNWSYYSHYVGDIFGAPLAIEGLMAFFLEATFVGLFFFGWVILLGGTQSFIRVTALIAIIAGMGTWMFGASNSIHIGASGIVFGYMAFLLLRGFFEKSLRWVMVALIVAFVIYGFVDLGFSSSAENDNGAVNISWSGHLSGFAGGIIPAWIFYYRPRNSPYAQKQITKKPTPSPIVSAILTWFSKRH